MGGPQGWSGRGGEQKNSQLLTGLELLIIQPIAQRYNTELHKAFFQIIFCDFQNKDSNLLKHCSWK
jgi:hypothetical protein